MREYRTTTAEDRRIADEMAEIIRDKVYDPWNNTPESIAEALVEAGFRRVDTTSDTGYTEGNNETTEV